MNKGDISESIKVYIRERPQLIGSETEETVTSNVPSDQVSGIKSVATNKKACTYYSATSKLQQEFSVDYYFEPRSQQNNVFETIALPIVESALQGYSGTILAYGPTSSGKTHTMRGSSDAERGIMPRCIERLLRQQESSSCEIWASYLQIYCETITDLLWQPVTESTKDTPAAESGNQIVAYSANQPLLLRERATTTSTGSTGSTTSGGSGGSVYVEGLSRYRIQSVEDLDELLRRGDLNRSTAATNMNETSSRSHAVLIVKVITPEPSTSTSGVNTIGTSGNPSTAPGGNEESNSSATSATTSYRESTLMLVDLAGSERASASEGRSSMRAEEARAINLSLSALGNCMSALATASAEGKSGVHVPYRDSKLTRLLQGCIGGSARTAVVVTLAPGCDTAGESLSALRFASRASKVKVTAKVNRYTDYEALYKEAKLKLKEFQSSGGGGGGAGSAASEASKLAAAQAEMLQRKDAVIEEQTIEISLLKQQLQALQGGTSTGTSLGSRNTDNASGTDGTGYNFSGAATGMAGESGNESVATAAELLTQMESMRQQQVIALEAAHRLFQSKITKAQQAEQAALRELSARQEDIKQERERNLNTMRMLRESQDRRNEEEDAHKLRTAEFLEEIASQRDANEDLRAQNEMLQQRVKELTAQLSDSVSKVQVQEMESLFIETVTRLSERVNSLEGKRAPAGEAAGGGSGARSGGSAGGGAAASVTREVRIEPGGRIRATSTQAGTSSAKSGSVSSVGSVGGGGTQSMQHSQSTGAVTATSGGNTGFQAPGGSRAATEDAGARKGKLW